MTDTTDIKALRELAFNANSAITRLSANGEECLYAIGEGTQIDKDVELSNQFHKAFNPIVVIYLLDQLEAERQQADEAERAKENATYEWGEAQSNYDSAKSEIRSLEAEIAALKAKLTNQYAPAGFLFIVNATGQVVYSVSNNADIEGATLVGQVYGKAAGFTVKE